MSRIGQRLLAIGGLGLAALMAYTVALDFEFNPAVDEEDSETPRIAVFFPERIHWREFREGIQVCARKRLLRIVEETDLTVVVESLKSSRRLCFEWRGVRGVVGLKEEVESLLVEDPQPPAIIGSSTTVLTQAIAEALGDAAAPGADNGPMLLIPWASAVLTDRSEPGDTPVALLDIHSRRTFRFCNNNKTQATLLVRSILSRDSSDNLDRVILVEDRQDPYSIDLVDAFHRAIERAVPRVGIDERSLALGLSVLANSTSSEGMPEDAVAASIWEEIEKVPEKHSLWVVLPIQVDLASRIIEALGRQARRSNRKETSSIKVLAGDSMTLDLMESLAGRSYFPIVSVSTNSPSTLPAELVKDFSADSQIPAEIVSSLIFALDEIGDAKLTADRLREQLEAIDWKADDPHALGRTLRFSRSGERISDDLGHVLAVNPDDPRVFEIPRLGNDRFGPAVPLDPNRITIQP